MHDQSLKFITGDLVSSPLTNFLLINENCLVYQKTCLSNIMHFRYGVTILKSIIVVTLFIVYYQFFFKDVIENYSEGLTNIATTLKAFGEDEIGVKAPAFAICMEPQWKKEILEKYNISSEFFLLQKGSFEHMIGKKTMKEIIYEASFRVNEDFKIAITAITSLNHFEPYYLNIGTNTFTSNENEFVINVTEIYSILSGMCYIIQSNLYISTKYTYAISVILQSDNITQKPNQMHLTATSDDDALGIVFGLWGDAKRLTLPNIQFNNKTTLIDLQEVIKTRISNCNEKGTTYQKCLATGYENAKKSSSCPDKCTPMAIKSYHEKYFGDGEILQTCNNLKHEDCLIRNLQKFDENVSQCESQCQIKNYNADPQILTDPIKLYLDGERADLLLWATSRKRYLIKEYRIYDTVGMIGTVGGSLGLFLGFSFYGVFSDVLNLLVKKLTMQD